MSDDAPTGEEAPPSEDAPAVDENAEMFPRSYVEELRQEAASRRTQLREYEEAFDGYSLDEKEALLSLTTTLATNPADALPEFQRITRTLEKELGIMPEAPEPVDPPAVAEVDPSAPTPKAITESQLEEWYNKRKESEQQEAAEEAKVRSVFDQAAKISDEYKEGSGALVQLLHVAQNDPAAEGTLEGAHKVLMAQIDEIQKKAVQDYRDGIRSGATHPPVTATGTQTTGEPSELPLTIEAASKRASERLKAAGMGS